VTFTIRPRPVIKEEAMRMHRCFIALLLALTTTATAFAGGEELVSLQSREGIEQKFILIMPDQPTAAVILFAGGKGALGLGGEFGGASIGWGRNNFLVRSRDEFAERNLMVAVVDAPSDRQGKRGMLGGFRSSDDHVTDIDAVIAELRRRADVPVWLVGTSRGTESAAHIAIHSGQQPHGLVLTSSMSKANNSGDTVTEMAIGRIRMPTLIVAHEQDGCNKTPPEGAEKIRARLTQAGKVEVKFFNGGHEESKPCQAMSHHGFLGIERDVVAYITDFIKAN
jgi:dienelactone hydrolase